MIPVAGIGFPHFCLFDYNNESLPPKVVKRSNVASYNDQRIKSSICLSPLFLVTFFTPTPSEELSHDGGNILLRRCLRIELTLHAVQSLLNNRPQMIIPVPKIAQFCSDADPVK